MPPSARILPCAWLCAALLAGCSAAPPGPASSSPEPAAEPQPTLVVLGDSLTAGLGVPPEQALPALLQRRLQDDGLNWKVVNAGVSGETSAGARNRVDWVARLKPNWVLLETGANDGLRGLDPAQMERNLDGIVAELQRRRIGVIVAGMQAPRNLGGDYARRFDAVYPRVARNRKVPLIPFYLEGVAAHPALNQGDGLHPNARGYAVICQKLAPLVEAELRRRPQ